MKIIKLHFPVDYENVERFSQKSKLNILNFITFVQNFIKNFTVLIFCYLFLIEHTNTYTRTRAQTQITSVILCILLIIIINLLLNCWSINLCKLYLLWRLRFANIIDTMYTNVSMHEPISLIEICHIQCTCNIINT